MKKIQLLFLFLGITIFSSSGQGCAVNYGTSTEVIYYGPLAGTRNFGPPIAYNNGPSTAYPNACPKYDYYKAETNSQSCRVNGALVGNYFIPASNFALVPCPIDNYIPFLILPIGSFGFSFLRKRQFIHK